MALERLLVLITVWSGAASKFAWLSTPSVQHACIGDDVILQWSYETNEPVPMVLLQSSHAATTVIECGISGNNYTCSVEPQFKQDLEVVEMTKGLAKYRLLKVDSSNDGRYILQLIGPKVSSESTVISHLADDITAEIFFQEEVAKPNTSYICDGNCETINVLVKTNLTALANISIYDSNHLAHKCQSVITCKYVYKPQSKHSSISVHVNHGICGVVILDFDILVPGFGKPRNIVIIISVLVITTTAIIIIIIIIKFRRCRPSYDLHSIESAKIDVHNNEKQINSESCAGSAEKDIKDSEGIRDEVRWTSDPPRNEIQKDRKEKGHERTKNNEQSANNTETLIDDIIAGISMIAVSSPDEKIQLLNREEIPLDTRWLPNHFKKYRDNQSATDLGDDEPSQAMLQKFDDDVEMLAASSFESL